MARKARAAPRRGPAQPTPKRGTRARRDDAFRIEAVGRARWPDLETLFEGRGGPHYCWCMVWRDMPSNERKDKAKKKAALKARVDTGEPVGLIAYDGDAPVAWCSLGPRRTVPRLTKERGEDTNDAVWTIACFFVQRPYRARGLTAQLIAAAADHARKNGATTIEAYPVAEGAPSYRFLGFVKHFAAAGFTAEGRIGAHRHLMRRALG